MKFYTYYQSPLGTLTIQASDDGILGAWFEQQTTQPEELGIEDALHPVLQQAVSEFQAYFAGELKDFELPLQPQGTEFQRDVWQALVAVQWGKICSYSDIANTINRPKAVRAVGAANGRNPIPIIIPCHRVIGSNGTLTGYYGGVHIKQALLAIEGHTQYQPSLL